MHTSAQLTHHIPRIYTMSDTTINRLTMAKAEGKRLRKKVAREDHATLELPKHRDVLDLIHQRNKAAFRN